MSNLSREVTVRVTRNERCVHGEGTGPPSARICDGEDGAEDVVDAALLERVGSGVDGGMGGVVAPPNFGEDGLYPNGASPADATLEPMLATLYKPALSVENVLVTELVIVDPHDDGEKAEAEWGSGVE